MNIARSIPVVTLLAFGTGCAETVAQSAAVPTSAGPVVEANELPPDSPGLAPVVSETRTSTWNHYGVDHRARRGLSGGAIAGIVLGTVGGAALIGLLVASVSAMKSTGSLSFGHCCNWAGD
jgi:hypothetical protein